MKFLLQTLSFLVCATSPKVIEVQLERRQAIGRQNHKRYKDHTKRRNLAYDYDKELMNFYNYQYFGTLYLGSHLQEMDFIFDTGSDWTWVPNEDCPASECPMDHYKYHWSKSYEELSSYSETIEYGIGMVQGYPVRDHVALTQSYWTQAKNVNFLSIFHAREMENLQMDGLLGLAPSPWSVRNIGSSGVSLFVDELEEDGVIDERMFSVFLADTNTQSKIHFGGWDQTIVDAYALANQSQYTAPVQPQYDYYNWYNQPAQPVVPGDDGIHWLKVSSEYYWAAPLRAAKIDGEVLQVTQAKAFFDTGSTLNYLPNLEYRDFMTKVRQNQRCWFNDEMQIWYCMCNGVHDPNWPEITFQLGEVGEEAWFSMKGRDYLMVHHHSGYFDFETFTWVRSYYACTVMIQEQVEALEGTGWLLGDPFLRAHYTIHDLAQMRIGVVPVVEALREQNPLPIYLREKVPEENFTFATEEELASSYQNAPQFSEFMSQAIINKVNPTVTRSKIPDRKAQEQKSYIKTVVFVSVSTIILCIFVGVCNIIIKRKQKLAQQGENEKKAIELGSSASPSPASPPVINEIVEEASPESLESPYNGDDCDTSVVPESARKLCPTKNDDAI